MKIAKRILSLLLSLLLVSGMFAAGGISASATDYSEGLLHLDGQELNYLTYTIDLNNLPSGNSYLLHSIENIENLNHDLGLTVTEGNNSITVSGVPDYSYYGIIAIICNVGETGEDTLKIIIELQIPHAFEISNYSDLKEYASQINSGNIFSAKLTADIIAKNNESDEEYATDWIPIAQSRRFTSIFDGKGHKITGLSGDLFGEVREGGIIRNVGLESGNTSGNDNAGSIVRNLRGGSVTNCYNTGNISGFSSVGGIVGLLENGTVTNCYNTGNISGNSSVGGIVGRLERGKITNCYYDKKVCGNIGAVDGADIDTEDNKVKGLDTDDMTEGRYTGGVVTNMPGFKAWSEGSTDEDAVWLVREPDAFGCYYPHLKGFDYDKTGVVADWPALIPSEKGTATAPYEIKNYSQLRDFASIVNNKVNQSACAKLMNDIECKNNPADAEYATDWTPIGYVIKDTEDKITFDAAFTGTFDGGGHVITGLTCNDSSADYAGLFGYVDVKVEGTVTIQGTVKNVGLEGGAITGKNYVGGVVGYNNGGTVTNCYNTGNVSGNENVGGVVGYNNGGTVTSCYNTGTVSGNNEVGGLVGYNYRGSVTNCYNAGAVSGNDAVGGVVGKNDGAQITYCYYDKSVCGDTGAVDGSDSDTVKGLTSLHMTGNKAICYSQEDYSEDSNRIYFVYNYSESPWLTKANEAVDGGANYWYYPHLRGFNLDAGGNQLPADSIQPEDWPAKITQNPDPEMNLSAPGITYGEDLVITAAFADGVTGDVAFTVDSIGYTAPIQNGKAVLTVGSLGAGKYAVKADFPGNESYAPAFAQTEAKVNKKTPEIGVTATDAFIGGKTKINVTYPAEIDSETPSNYSGNIITIWINGIEAASLSGENGVVEQYYDVRNLSPGTQTVTAVFTGSENHNSTTAQTTFEVTQTIQAGKLNAGDTFEMGMYPQTQVTDTDTIAALEAVDCEMTSYGYIKNSTETVNMSYADIEYNGNVYRKVKIDEYRPKRITDDSDAGKTMQDEHGYTAGNSYYFLWEPIVWKVRRIYGEDVIVLSEYAIDAQAYNNSTEETNWIDCTIRQWLNDEFYRVAFSSSEKGKIKTTEVRNDPYVHQVQDNVWLLSRSEATSPYYGFDSDGSLLCSGTEYAESQGLWLENGNNGWWTCTCNNSNKPDHVDVWSNIGGHEAYYTDTGVRPALLLDPDAVVGISDPVDCRVAGEHSYGDWTSVDADNHKKVCSVCGDTVTETHGWNPEWISDGTNHWHECSDCGTKKDEATHSYGDTGADRYTCTICRAEDAALKAAAELADAKKAAKTTLENYKNAADYRPAQQTELADAIAAGKDAIDNATDTYGVATALADAKAAIDTIKTDVQLTAEELAAAKTAAKQELDEYKNPADYRDNEKAALSDAIGAGKDAIDNATDTAGVESALAAAKAVIDTIKTDAQLTAEELAAAKTAAKQELDEYKNPADYRDNEKAALSDAIGAGKDAIDNAADTDGVATALADAKAAIDTIKTDAQLTAEELAANKAAFNEYKEQKLSEIDAMAQEGDSEATKALIDGAKDELDELAYYEDKTLDENKAAADAIVEKLKDDLAERRKEYTATFIADGKTVKEEKFTVETEKLDEPEVPAKDGYEGKWSEYKLAASDIEINAVYTPVEYTATFVADGKTVAEIPYTVETKSIEAPAVPEKEGYTGEWEEYKLAAGGVTVNAEYTAIEYKATFVGDGKTVAEIPYTVETKNIEAPAVPEKEGYTGEWEEYKLAAGGITVNAVYTEIDNPDEPDEPENEDLCPLDEKDHGTSFWGKLIRFIHTVIYKLFKLFGVNLFIRINFNA